MRKRLTRNDRQWLIGLLLVTLVVRALIPAGFMPATDRPFSFQICPDGFPAHLLRTSNAHADHDHHQASPTHGAHDHHDAGGSHEQDDEAPRHSSASNERCVFAAALGATPLAYLATILGVIDGASEAPPSPDIAPVPAAFRFRTPPPRGPPAFS